MNNKLYDAFETCLRAMQNGASLDSVLARYPKLASELRPILKASQRAREITVPRPSADVMRRGRAQLLQRASEMRESRRKPAWRQSVIPLFQRLAFALTLAVVFLMSGTGLVQASSSALPGENLYPVKRTWEDVRLLFIFTHEIREAMEGEYEQERLEEVSELLREGRVVSITFTGLVTSDQSGNLLVSGVPVAITSKTVFSGEPLLTGAAVTVTGQTDVNGNVTAMTLQVLQPGAFVPTGDPAQDSGDDSSPSTGSGNGNSSPSNENDSNEKPQNNEPDKRSGSFHIEGTVQSVQGNVWIIDGQTVYMDNVSLPGNITVGSQVEVKGYFTTDGRFIVTRIEIKNSTNNSDDENDNSDDNNNINENQNSNDNSNMNDNSNVNDNGGDNENDNLNSNDNSGGDGGDDNSNKNDNEH